MEERHRNKPIRRLTGFMIVAAAIAVISGCGKPGGECFTNSGPVIFQERDVSDFDSIDVRDYVNLILTQDSVNRVTVEAGKNIIGGITTEVVNRELRIDNRNSCNWLRDYNKPINVHISVRNLWKIYYLSSGNITATDTLRSDSLKIEIWGGCGTIDLPLHIVTGYFIMQLGTVDMHLHGRCPILTVYSADYGLIDARDLGSSYLYVRNKSSNDTYVNSDYFMSARIESIGNIYYTGNPDSVVTSIQGGGQVIPF
jgi:hypothetical protein